jgi:hypothetical protein
VRPLITSLIVQELRLLKQDLPIVRLLWVDYLTGSDVFSSQLVKRIDSVTSMAYFNIVVRAYDYKNNRIYEYTGVPGDSVQVDAELLDNARIKGSIYFTTGKKEDVVPLY